MSQVIPFLQFFAALGEGFSHAGAVAAWKLSRAVIHKETRSLEAKASCPVLPDEATRRAVEDAIRTAYGIAEIQLELEVEELSPAAAEQAPAPAAEPKHEPETSPEEDPALAAFRRTEELRAEAMRNIQRPQVKEKREERAVSSWARGPFGSRPFPCPS